MQKLIYLTIFVLFVTNSYSQLIESDPFTMYYGKGSFVIKGKAENKPSDMNVWQLAVTGYISNVIHDIPVNVDGSFKAEIPITDVQDIYLYLGDAIIIFSYPGDTIEVFFDCNNPKETLRLKGNTADREKELALCMQIFKKHRQAYLDISRLRLSNIKDEDALAKLNEYYDNKIETINSFEKENGKFPFLEKFRDETYFYTISNIPIINAGTREELLPKVHYMYTTPNLPYKYLSPKRFKTNKHYREFLESHVSHMQFTSSMSKRFASISASIKKNYYFALACLNDETIRDWYITCKLNYAFTYSDFDETSFVYNEFKEICTNKDYLDLLEPKYKAAFLTKPGSPAPDFELKDENGKTIKLSDLRGKIIYLDFWATGCGSCIYEFQNSMSKFHEKYKDSNITYVYIDVDDNEANWKRGIEQYKLEGINLIAEGWVKHPVCQAYNVFGIPHYVLIDEEGIIVENHADRPSYILMKGANSKFDQLVNKKK